MASRDRTDASRTPRVVSGLAPGLALLPLRLFLGITFVYGGVQKLADPGFLHPGAPTYIGTQLRGFAGGTPGGFILRAFALPVPKLAGVGVALVEILVGLLVCGGLVTRLAAAAGLALNLLLFLTASWKTHPYFLGSDIVFVFAWLPFVLTGAQGQPAVDHVLDRVLSRRREPRRPGAHPRGLRPGGAPALTRRDVLGRALGMSGAATLVLAGLATLARGSYRGPSATVSLGGRARGGGPRPAGAHGTAGGELPVHHHPGGPAPPPGAIRLGPSARLRMGQAATYRDPHDGRPDIVVRDSAGGLTALSALCTHAGCPVQYQQGVLYCPCHGSVFNAKTGAVEQGPAQTPLVLKRVAERGGSIYAVPS